jgi:PAS domain S-box-containing protein
MRRKKSQSSRKSAAREIAELRARLAEAEETLDAIRSGAVDALVVSGPEGEQVFALKGAETPYRLLVEAMHEAALLLDLHGTILYGNYRLSAMARCAPEHTIGRPLTDFLIPQQAAELRRVLTSVPPEGRAAEFVFQPRVASAKPFPIQLAVTPLRLDLVESLAVVITDLTTQKAYEAILHQSNQELGARVQQRSDELRQSEERFQLSMEATHDGLWDWNTETGDAYFSPAYFRMLGHDPKEFSGTAAKWLELVHPEDREPAWQGNLDCIEGRCEAFEVEFRMKAHDGQWHWILRRGKCVARDARRRALRLVGTHVDITQRKRAEEALRQSEATLKNFYDSSSFLMGVVELHGHDVISVHGNKMVAQFFGRAPEQLAGCSARELIQSEETARLWLEKYQFSLRENRAVRFECEHPCTRGRVWLSVTVAPLTAGTNGVPRFSFVAEDVTERKRAQQALARNKEELERLVEERTARLRELVGELEHFSYTITHDMRAPLRSMRGFAELVSELCAPCQHQEQKLLLGRIITSAQRMDLLITDALSYSKAVRQDLPLGPVDLGALLRGIVESYPEFQASRAHIDVAADIPLVYGNHAGLTQCFSNLLGNAVKFVEPGRTPEIRVRAEVTAAERAPDSLQETPQSASLGVPAPAHWVRIWVEDNGIGIPSVMVPRLFNLFSRGIHGQDGTGLGLALVRKVVDRMGGRVGVESEPGKGSRFWVELHPGNRLQVPPKIRPSPPQDPMRIL